MNVAGSGDEECGQALVGILTCTIAASLCIGYSVFSVNDAERYQVRSL